jgi:hypothetical protein
MDSCMTWKDFEIALSSQNRMFLLLKEFYYINLDIELSSHLTIGRWSSFLMLSPIHCKLREN